MIRKKISAIGATVSIYLLGACIAFAADNGGAGSTGGPTGSIGGSSISLPNPLGGGCTDLTCPLNSVINFIYTISLPLCGLMVLWGGFQIMTSAGNPEKFSKGRSTILYAAIGFVVILLAKGVAASIQSFFS